MRGLSSSVMTRKMKPNEQAALGVQAVRTSFFIWQLGLMNCTPWYCLPLLGSIYTLLPAHWKVCSTTMSTIQTSQLSLFILAFSLWFGGHAHSDDKPTFKDAPLTVNELADLLGIKKTGVRVQFPEPRYARLVAEIQVKGKVRQEFVTLKQATKEFTIATFVQTQSHSSSFRRMCFEIAVEVGESERRFINDFAGADIEQSFNDPAC